MLTAEQQKLRENKLTASRVGILMSGNNEKILNLWKELVGDPSFVPEDLSNVWPVQLGSHTESLHLKWYEKQTGRTLTRHGEVVEMPFYGWAASTLDAFDPKIVAPVEAKHCGGFEKMETIVQRYMPQLTWQIMCCDTKQGVLSVILGAQEPQQTEINRDDTYARLLFERASKFMECVQNLSPPCVLPPIVAPVPQEKMRVVDMSGSNVWNVQAASWLENKSAAKVFETAQKELKALIEPDVGEAYGAGVVAKRSKSGSILFKEAK